MCATRNKEENAHNRSTFVFPGSSYLTREKYDDDVSRETERTMGTMLTLECLFTESLGLLIRLLEFVMV